MTDLIPSLPLGIQAQIADHANKRAYQALVRSLELSMRRDAYTEGAQVRVQGAADVELDLLSVTPVPARIERRRGVQGAPLARTQFDRRAA